MESGEGPDKPKGPTQQLRQFSKEHSKEERAGAARLIRSKRGEHFQKKRDLISKQEEISLKGSEHSAGLEATLNKLAGTEQVLDELSSSWYSRSLHYLERRKLQAQVEGLQLSKSQTEENLRLLESEDRHVRERLAEPGKNYHFEDARKLLEDFYKGEKEKWEKSPYSKEDIKRYFSEEYLSSLSVEEYTELMNRFGNRMVFHVTRQGVRDHLGHYAHTGGYKKYHNEFEKILEDGQLRSALGVYLKEGVKKEAVLQFFLNNVSTKEEAIEMLDHVVDRYADKSAVHVAVGLVAAGDYGAEEGNEIFFAFPSAYVASNYYFSGTAWLDSLNSQWNDQWILSADESTGININAGLVYIPEDVKVSPVTGSKYELDEDHSLIENQEYVDQVRKIILDEEFIALANRIDAANNRDSKISVLELQGQEHNTYGLDPELFDALFTDKRNGPVISVIYLADALRDIPEGEKREEIINDYAKGVVEKAGMLYVKAQNPISAREYWENYFSEHPQQRPNKIIWYSGTVREDIIGRDYGSVYGEFPENADYPPNLAERKERFYQVAREAIEEHFAEKEAVA